MPNTKSSPPKQTVGHWGERQLCVFINKAEPSEWKIRLRFETGNGFQVFPADSIERGRFTWQENSIERKRFTLQENSIERRNRFTGQGDEKKIFSARKQNLSLIDGGEKLKLLSTWCLLIAQQKFVSYNYHHRHDRNPTKHHYHHHHWFLVPSKTWLISCPLNPWESPWWLQKPKALHSLTPISAFRNSELGPHQPIDPLTRTTKQTQKSSNKLGERVKNCRWYKSNWEYLWTKYIWQWMPRSLLCCDVVTSVKPAINVVYYSQK